MAKRKGRKPGTTDYKKLATRTAMELADKKKALAKAEKTLATATKSHAELLQETARLDMLERSLKALVEGTEPPQNVRYVYTYPQWVWTNQWWQGNPYGWWRNGNTWSVNLGVGQTQTYPQYNSWAIQGGQSTTTNAVTTPVVTTSGALNTTLTCDSSISGLADSLGHSSLSNAGSLTLASASPSAYTMTTTNGPSSSVVNFTVDLSTGATDDETEQESVSGAAEASAVKAE